MELGIFGLPGNFSFMEAIDYAVENHFDALEPYSSHEFAQPDEAAIEKAKRLKEYAAEKGVTISCFSMGINITTGDYRANIERLKGYARVAAAMGSPYLHHTLLPGLAHNRGTEEPFDTLLNRAVDGIREVYDYAESVGVKAIYEDQGYVFNGCERFERLLDRVDREIRVVADLGNILFVGESPVDFVGRFAPYIAHVHVKDYLYKPGTANYPGEEWYGTRNGDFLRGTIVGHGVIDFVTVCRILISAGYTGSYSLEFDGKEDPYMAARLSNRNFHRYYAQAEALLQYKGSSAVPHT